MKTSVLNKSNDFRFSSYSIVSSPLPGGGYTILNSISGAIDLISDDIGTTLNHAFRDRTSTAPWIIDDELTTAIIADLPVETFNDFVDRGHLTKFTREAERELVREIAQATHDAQKKYPHFMIVPTLDCNYRCTYCFERPIQNKLSIVDSDINYHSKNVVMTFDHISAIFSSISQIKREEKAKLGGQIILYGGEPLEASNLTVVNAIVNSGVEAGFCFAAITNGHDLDHYEHLLGTGKIETIQISIDGPKAIHDSRRIHIGRESSFEKIVANITSALESTDVEIQLRVHLDPANIDAFESVLLYFHKRGWTNNPRFIIYANTVYEKDKHGHVAARIETGELGNRLRAITRRFKNVFTSGPAVHGARTLNEIFETGERFQAKGTYCSANIGNYIFAPDGHMYACWESVGKPCSRIGTYFGEGGLIFDEEKKTHWFSRSVALIPECLECSFALVCGGGCAQYSEYNKGDLYKPYCDDFQRLFSNLLADELDLYLDQNHITNQKEDDYATKEHIHQY